MNITQTKKKNGETVCRASVYLGVDSVTGKKVKTTITARTKKEVKQKANLEKLEFQKAGSTRVKACAVRTYAELAELWWDSYHHTIKPSSQVTMRDLLDSHVLPLFGSYKLDKLTTPLIQSVINDLANQTNKGIAGAYLHFDKIHALNKRILQYAVTMQAIPYNPARDVVLPRNTQKAKREKLKFFDAQTLKQFLDYLDSLDLSEYKNVYKVTLYKLLLATGCRIGEAVALEWSDIDLDKATISITKTINRMDGINSPKSQSSYRDIDIDSDTVAMLKAYKRRQTQESWKLGQTESVVFSEFLNPYPDRGKLRSRLRTDFRRAGVPNIGFHGFRHTHASLLLNAGIPYKELQHRLGHSTLAMTMDTYSHLYKETAKKAVSIFETAMNAL